jgi:negative regulator of flagellin synthesis FlgM
VIHPGSSHRRVAGQPNGSNKEKLMKIENVIRPPAIIRGKESRSAPARPMQADKSAISDQVNLTATAEKMSQLEGNLSEVEVSDQAKIEAIRQAIAEGRFKVDEQAVAENLVQETLANISRHAQRFDD